MSIFGYGIVMTVKAYVFNSYGYSLSNMVSPFSSGDDYRDVDYTGKVVVDFPPFSQIGEICNYYNANGVKFFLYIPAVCDLVAVSSYGTVIDTNVILVDEQLLERGISFVTNMETGSPKPILKTSPTFRSNLLSSNSGKRAEKTRQLNTFSTNVEKISLWLSDDYVTEEHTVGRS